MKGLSAEQRWVQLAPLFDASSVLAAAIIAAWIRFDQTIPEVQYLLAVLLGFLLTLVLLPVTRGYRSQGWLRPGRGTLKALPGLLSVAGCLLAAAMATKTTAEFSRIWMGLWFALTPAFMSLWRALLYAVRLRLHPRIVILGTGPLALDVALRLTARKEPIQLLGFISLPDIPSTDQLPAPILGDLAQMDTLLTGPAVMASELWVATETPSDGPDESLLERLRLCSLPVFYLPSARLRGLLDRGSKQLAGETLIELNATPLDGPEGQVKSLLDRLLAAILIVLLLPVLLIIALLLRLDSPGPVLFRQARHGSGGRIIQVLKFRSMTHSAKSDTRQVTRNDPRVTRLGAWLRRSSVDELPQLINVLRGEMSLVGPRPHPVTLNLHYADKLDAYMRRHRVKPGITGWAQINGLRGETDTIEKMRARLEHDLYYIENWSLWLDIKILARTILCGWSGPNAY